MLDFQFRRQAVDSLTEEIGCYALCDLDQNPLFVGRSNSGVRSRVHKDLISATSHIITNRQIDIWEIAWVWAYPVLTRAEIDPLAEALRYEFQHRSFLVNGRPTARPEKRIPNLEPAQVVQVMPSSEIAKKKDPALRLPRQAEHYSQIVGHFLAVKNSQEIAGAIQAHFERLRKYHHELLGLATEVEGDAGDD